MTNDYEPKSKIATLFFDNSLGGLALPGTNQSNSACDRLLLRIEGAPTFHHFCGLFLFSLVGGYNLTLTLFTLHDAPSL